MGVNLGDRQWLKFPWDAMMVGVLATVVVVVIGYSFSRVLPSRQSLKAVVLWDAILYHNSPLEQGREKPEGGGAGEKL